MDETSNIFLHGTEQSRQTQSYKNCCIWSITSHDRTVSFEQAKYYIKYIKYLPSRANASSDNKRPTRKCCLLKANDNSAILLAGVRVSPEARDDSDVVGEEGSEGYNWVGKGRLRVT